MDSSTTTMATPETRKKASAIDRQKRHVAVRYLDDRQRPPGQDEEEVVAAAITGAVRATCSVMNDC